MLNVRLLVRLSPAFLALALIAGCGGGGGGGGTTAPVISVGINPLIATLIGGGTQTFTATVANDSTGAGVTWTASTGTITTAGVYTAPAIITTTSATVTATSKTDTTKNATAAITLTPISLNPISPASVILGSGGSQVFTDTVANDSSNSGVTWSIGTGVGTLTASSTTGVTYNAPATATGTGAVTLTATSIKDPTKSTTATITLTSLTVTTAGTLPNAILNAAYSQTLAATGGSGSGYTWTVTSGATGTNSLGSLNLSVSSTGVISGTPTTTGTANFTVQVKDSSNNTASASFTVTASATYTVSGQITFSLGCLAGGLNGITLSINTTPVQTTTTNGSGNFSFSNVPNGTYTITPSVVGQAPVFYPSTQSVTVNGGNFVANFGAALGYTVSGTVNYAGTQTGPIYLTLNNSGCGGHSLGTSVSTAGTFTIRGVPPGSYYLQAFMDTLGKGSANASNPASSATAGFVSSNITGSSVTLIDPPAVSLTTAPQLSAVSGFNAGAIAQFKAITNSSGVEMATSYTLQWSNTSSFTTIAGTKTFPATGSQSKVWFVNGLTDGSVYYFRAYGTSAGTATSPYSSIVGPVTIGAPTGGNVVSGSVSFTGNATGPLYTGFYDQNTGAFYGRYLPNPVNSQAYSVQVPNGSNYIFVGVVDQNNDGAIDTGDISNTGSGNSQTATVISGPTSNANLTLPGANAIATVTTQNYQSIFSAGSVQSYNLVLQVNGLIKQPVTVTLASGPNVISPVDVGLCGGPGSSCGQGFQIYFNTYSVSPQVNDTYTFNVTYSDGTTGTLSAKVTGVLSAFPTGLAPQTGTSTSTTPTFTWTDPINPSSYIYQFYMNDSTGNPIWQVPGSNAKSSGFSSAITSLTWGTDPTGGGSVPTLGSLTLGTSYSWQVQVQDSNGNSATTQVQYQP